MSEQAVTIIDKYAQQGAKLRSDFFSNNSQKIIEIARVMSVSLVHGGKIMFCGNGGSAADAQHLAAEFVGRFQIDRPSLPGLALNTNTSVLTALCNDFGNEYVFSKQVKALAKEGDILVGISTSGRSQNVIEAISLGKEHKIVTVGLVGKNGGSMLDLCDYGLSVPEDNTALVQEIHISVGHMLCRLVDYFLFEAVDKLQPYL